MRYQSGGSDPSGFDCSGLVQYVFARQGIAMPRDVRRQFQVGYEIPTDEVRPGDLLFFETESDGASHVGIAHRRRAFVHAPNSRGVVRVERLSTAYWSAPARRAPDRIARHYQLPVPSLQYHEPADLSSSSWLGRR